MGVHGAGYRVLLAGGGGVAVARVPAPVCAGAGATSYFVERLPAVRFEQEIGTGLPLTDGVFCRPG